MRNLIRGGLALTLCVLAPAALAGDLESGLQPGQAVDAFNVVKCAGPDDGVQLGATLCYR